MRHPLEYCATKYCCCCWNLDPNITCFIIAILCILLNAFSGTTNYGIWHWALYLVSLLLFALHLLAGLLLLIGAYRGNYFLKLAYCWIAFCCVFIVLIAFVVFVVLHKSKYIIWGSKCHNFQDFIGILLVTANSIWLIFFDLYSTIMVLGNLYNSKEYNDENAAVFYA